MKLDMKVLGMTEMSIEMKNLLEKNKALVEEKGKLEEEKHRMKEDYQRLASEVKHLRTENSELRQRVIATEIKLTLLTNSDLLEEKFGELQWSELPPAFQKELLGKLDISDRCLMKFDEIIPINSKALRRLIKADEEDETLLKKIIEDYYEEKKRSNGEVVWEDLDDSLRVYLTSKLRENSEVESFELEQVPLSSNTLVHLIQDKTANNPGYLGKIVAGYVNEMVSDSSIEVEDLFKVALLNCINSEIIGCLEIDFGEEELETLVERGMLRKTECEFEAQYEFVHDCVRHCVFGMIINELMKQMKVSRMNAFKLFYGRYMSSDPLGVYFADYMSEVEQSSLEKFDFAECDDDTNTLANLLMTLGVMRLPTLEAVKSVLEHFDEIDYQDIVLSRKLPPSEELTFTLLHAAAIRGDMERVNCHLDDFGFSEELSDPHFGNLVLVCVENTKECSGEQVQQRKEIIQELLKSNEDLVNCVPPSTSLNVHHDLIKFVIGLRARC